MKKILALLFLLAPAAAYSQQWMVECVSSASQPCALAANPGNGTQGDPPYLAFAKINQNAINSHEFDIQAYGALCNGSTDDSVSIAATVAAASNAGGGVIVGNGTCAVANPITVSASRVVFSSKQFGDGGHDTGSQDNGWTLAWTGASGGTVLSFIAPTGAANQALYGDGMQGVTIDCRNSAATGLEIESVKGGEWNGVYTVECTTAGIDTIPVSLLGEASDVQGNRFSGIRNRTVLSSGAGVRMRGIASHNTSFDAVRDASFLYKNGPAILLQNTDNLSFENVQAVQASGGTSYGVDVSGDSTGSANSIFFYGLSAGAGGTRIRGTETLTTAVKNVQFLGYDLSNSIPIPTYGTGVTNISLLKENGHFSGSGFINGAAGGSDSELTLAIAHQAANNPNSSMYLYNGSQDGLNFDDGTGRWTIRQDGSHNFNVIQNSGTGVISLSATVNVSALYIQPNTIATLAACNSGNAGLRDNVSNGIASPTYQQTVSTTGTTTQSVYCNGTNWVYD